MVCSSRLLSNCRCECVCCVWRSWCRNTCPTKQDSFEPKLSCFLAICDCSRRNTVCRCNQHWPESTSKYRIHFVTDRLHLAALIMINIVTVTVAAHNQVCNTGQYQCLSRGHEITASVENGSVITSGGGFSFAIPRTEAPYQVYQVYAVVCSILLTCR